MIRDRVDDIHRIPPGKLCVRLVAVACILFGVYLLYIAYLLFSLSDNTVCNKMNTVNSQS